MKRPPFSTKRRRHVREPKRIFYLFCEGENTEPKYFAALQSSIRNALVDIQQFRAAGVPKTLTDNAIALRKSLRKGRRNSFEKRDEVWAIFDRDEHDSYYDAIKACKAAGVRVANSNPCFEVWLILHEQDFHKADGRVAVQKFLKKLRPEFDLKSKTLNFDEIVSRVELAESRAAKGLQCRIEEGGVPMGCPYTLVFELTASIRQAAATAT